MFFFSRVFTTKKISKDPLPWSKIENENVNAAVQSHLKPRGVFGQS